MKIAAKEFPLHEPKKGDKRGFMEWLRPRHSGYLLACCDCGLVHELQFRVREGRVEYRCRRARNYTKAMRGAIKHKCEIR
jgi:hypothetical protein